MPGAGHREPGTGSREPGAGWQQSSRKRAEVAAIATVGYPLLRALGSTWTWKVSGAEHVDAIGARGLHPIHSFWHGRILPATLYFQRRGIVVITSENYDGEWIARIIAKFGYGTARGSTSRGGPKALLQLVRDVKSKGVAFTLDGPRGPAEVAQAGAVWLSKATGNPLLPFHAEAASSWTMNSWDRTQIPKPFTTVAMAIAAPLYVPREANETELEQWRVTLQASLAECRERALNSLRP
jgi:lysophospholipid acyltransferase (LPLAT)-like uncharacterized protein